jgi:hypothetical protein
MLDHIFYYTVIMYLLSGFCADDSQDSLYKKIVVKGGFYFVWS